MLLNFLDWFLSYDLLLACEVKGNLWLDRIERRRKMSEIHISDALTDERFWTSRGFMEVEAKMAVIFVKDQKQTIELLRRKLDVALEALKIYETSAHGGIDNFAKEALQEIAAMDSK